MCQFLSFITTKDGRRLYAPERRTPNCNYDSHSYIARRYNITDADEPNFYEYAPIGDRLDLDASPLNRVESLFDLQQWARSLPYDQITPELVIKSIIHPLEISRGPVTEQEVLMLKKWQSVRASMMNNVVHCVHGSACDSVWGASVADSVRISVWRSLWDSIWRSVGGDVGDSVVDIVWAYISSFFNLPQWKYVDHEKNKNPFQCCVDLWESGLVPSFDGTVWRLHSGENAEVVYESRD